MSIAITGEGLGKELFFERGAHKFLGVPTTMFSHQDEIKRLNESTTFLRPIARDYIYTSHAHADSVGDALTTCERVDAKAARGYFFVGLIATVALTYLAYPKLVDRTLTLNFYGKMRPITLTGKHLTGAVAFAGLAISWHVSGWAYNGAYHQELKDLSAFLTTRTETGVTVPADNPMLQALDANIIALRDSWRGLKFPEGNPLAQWLVCDLLLIHKDLAANPTSVDLKIEAAKVMAVLVHSDVDIEKVLSSLVPQNASTRTVEQLAQDYTKV